jgi:hypothetical protein
MISRRTAKLQRSSQGQADRCIRFIQNQSIEAEPTGGDPRHRKTDSAGLLVTQLKRAIDMTDDELAAIVAKATLTVIK